MKDECISGAGSGSAWIEEFVVKPMMRGEVSLQQVPKHTYQFRPETSALANGLKTAGLFGALLFGAGLLASTMKKTAE